MPHLRNLLRSPLIRRASVLLTAFLAITFLTGGHCGNEVTAPLLRLTPTPVPTPAPASLSGGFDVAHPVNSIAVLVGATVKVTQGGITKSAMTNYLGHYQIDGLLSGAAEVTVTASQCTTDYDTITLVPGDNSFSKNIVCTGARVTTDPAE